MFRHIRSSQRLMSRIYAATLAMTLIVSGPAVWAQAPAPSAVETMTDEAALIAVLTGDSPKADKAMACKRLAVYGSPTAVPALGKLLADEQLASWTRIALEAIPGEAANAALRDACAGLQGNLLIGVVNSLGVRRDAQAISVLTGQLASGAPEVAEAAAVALGKIGGSDALAGLRPRLTSTSGRVQSAVAEGCVLCAEQLLAAGESKQAAEVYAQVRSTAGIPMQRTVEATRGLILSQQQAGIPALIEALRSPERKLFHVALQTAREMPSSELATALLAEVTTASSDRAPLIVQTLADMPGTVDIQTIVALAAQPGSQEIRMAALGAVGRTGNATCVVPLLKIAGQSEALIAPVKAALVELPDESSNQEFVARLKAAPGPVETQLLLEVIGLRRIMATDELLQALEHPQSSVRAAALQSLGSTIPQEQLSVLISQAITPKHSEDASAAAAALKAASVRMPDRETAAAQLTAAMPKASAAGKATLLEILGAMGGATALQTLETYARDASVQMKDVSSDLLGKWMTIDAAPVLLKLATTGPADKYQVRAMRGYIRIARQFNMSEEARVDMCQQAMQAAKQDAERKLVLEVLERYPSVGTLKLAIDAKRLPAIATEAERAVKNIAEKLKDNPDAQKLLK